ncbi:MAG: RNA polymerase sigma factor [Saprospiraceae bacterium]
MTVQTEFHKQILSHQKYLNHLAFKLTQSKIEAEDLTQETIIKLLQNEEKFQAGSNFKAWSGIVLRNTFINSYRKVVTRSERMSNLRKINAEKTNKNAGAANIAMEELKSIVELLSTTIKIPFLMLYQGYSYEEISSHLNIPMGTVKSRIFLARKILRKKLQ